MRSGRTHIRALWLFSTLIVATAVPSAGEERREVEEIVVTAQKREQAIEDVPISISVLDDEFIAEHGVTDLHEALLFVPNADVHVAGFAVTSRIRGFSFIQDNKAFEPPSGFALDGIVYPRFGYFQTAMLDVERVEVLRGPQGTTFGKNTTAGLIDVITKNPTDDFTGFVSVQLGERERRRFEVAVGGPIVKDVVNVRLAALSDEEEGFVENTTAAISPITSEHLRGRDFKALRAKLAFPSLFDGELVVSAELADLRDGGCGCELWHATPEIAALYRGYDPNVDFERGNFRASIDQRDYRKTKLRTFRGDWSRDVGGWDFHVLAAHSIYEEDVQLDNDFGPIPSLVTTDSDRSPTTTFEARVVSPQLDGLLGMNGAFGLDLGATDLLAGFFYQRRVLGDGELHLRANELQTIEILLAGMVDLPLEPPPLPPLPEPGLVEDYVRLFEQRGHAIAGFTQAEWHFAERWTLGAGTRLGYETKEADWDVRFDSQEGVLFLGAGFQEYVAHHSVGEFHAQPKVSLNYRPFEEVSLFAHWAKAYRSGGFNAFAARNVEDDLTYGSESASEWAIDAKTTLFDGSARLNVSFYRMDVTDFQVLTRIPLLFLPVEYPAVQNAPEARAQGLELDLTWLATDWLTIVGTVGFNDTMYVEFEFNDCPNDVDNADGDADSRCDATGRSFWGAPQWNNTLTANVFHPLAALPAVGAALPSALADVAWTASVTMEYTDVYYPDPDLDIRKRQPSFFRWRASAGLANPRQGWSFKVIGENLTNESVSLLDADVIPGFFVTVPDASRIVFGQFRWEF